MLRTIVSLNQLEALVSPDLITHIVDDFPKTSDAPLTLIEIPHEEATATWPAGFCRVDASPTDFDERLRFLPEPKLSPERSTRQVRRNGSALIHWLTRDKRSGA